MRADRRVGNDPVCGACPRLVGQCAGVESRQNHQIEAAVTAYRAVRSDRIGLHLRAAERKILGPNHLFLLRTGQKHEAIVRRRRLGSLALLGRAGRKGQQRRKRQPEDCSTPVAVTVQPIIARHVARSFHYSVYYSVPLTFAIRRNDTIASSSVPWM